MPYRIALAGLLVLVVAWFAVLRPKEETSTAPAPVTPAASAPSSTGATAPGVKGLGTAVDRAKGAVATSGASAKATEAAVGGVDAAQPAAAATKPAASAAAKPAAAAAKAAAPRTAGADRSDDVLAALGQGKVAVLLFSDAKAADDAHVRAVLRRIDRHGGKVAVFSAGLDEVGRYSAITRGVEILQGPTVVVVGRNRAARTIVGFTDRGELQQLIDDVGRFRA